VRPTVHTNPSRKRSLSKTLFKPEGFENAALFLRLGLPSTLIRHENEAIRKRSSNRRDLKTPAFRFRVDGNFSKTMASRQSCDFPDWIVAKHKSKMTADCCVFKFLLYGVVRSVWTENTWCVYRVKPPFSIFPRHSVNGKHLMRLKIKTSFFKFLRLSMDGASVNSKQVTLDKTRSPNQRTLST